MSKNKIKDYTDIGILELILDLCSPDQGQADNTRKEDIPFLTPVERIYPPITEPPYSFKDYILGSTKNPKTIYFPSNKDGTPKKWDVEQDTRFKAIDDFNAYSKHYNERVEDIWKRDGANNLESQHNHPLFKVDETPISPYSLIFTVYQHHYRQKNESPQKGDPLLRHVTNQLLWKIFKTNTRGVDVALIINKTIFDYMVLVTTERELKEGDLYYYPMREFERYAEKEGFDYDDIPNALDINTDAPKKEKVGVGGSPLDKVVSGDSVPNDFKITINNEHNKIRFSKGTGRVTDMLSAKELGIPPKYFDLIIRYGHFQKALTTEKNAEADWLWIDTVKEEREYETIQKYQSDLAKWCQTNLNMIENPFIKSSKVMGEQMMEGAFKTDTYRCHFDIRFEADWTETKQYKSIKGNVVDIDKKNR